MNLMESSSEIFATIFFALAIVHTFSVKKFRHLAHRFPEGSVGENFFHLIGEVEVVFGIWAGFFLVFLCVSQSTNEAIYYLETRNFTEPAFVFVIMTICSTRPILSVANSLINTVSRLLPLRKPVAFYATCLVLGPLLGSLISEPAAMTVTALILIERFYRQGMSQKFMYTTISLLFVNISVGGTLTPYAAPPVLMVAKAWSWDLQFMLREFGWKAIISIVLATTLITVQLSKEITKVSWLLADKKDSKIPLWVTAVHLLSLCLVIISSHHLVVFAGIFLFFLGLVSVTRKYHQEVKLREGLLVAFFLGGLVVLGGPQRWWLEPVLTSLDTFKLFLGAMSLTAFTDNAALTYLGAQVPSLSEASRYALVSGAVVGGGLTVIANAPNPAGYGILNSYFGEEGISPFLLFSHALVPTGVAAFCFWLL